MTQDGEQQLRGKSRGRIVHCSEFIYEHGCGYLTLSEEEVTAQMKLPVAPSPPPPPDAPGTILSDTPTAVSVDACATNIVSGDVHAVVSAHAHASISSNTPAVLSEAPTARGIGMIAGDIQSTLAGTKRAPKAKTIAKPRAPKKASNTMMTSPEGRILVEDWVPPPPPAPHKSYRLQSFDARRMIYPGANYDPWWDMPQLIL